MEKQSQNSSKKESRKVELKQRMRNKTQASVDKESRQLNSVKQKLKEQTITSKQAESELCEFGWSPTRAKEIVKRWIDNNFLNAEDKQLQNIQEEKKE